MDDPRALDLRLAVPATGSWLITWIGVESSRGSLVASILVTIALSGGAALALASGAGRGRCARAVATSVLAAAGLAVGVGVALLIRVDRTDAHPVRQLAGGTAVVVVGAIEDPKVSAANPELVWMRAQLHLVDGRTVPPAEVIVFASTRRGGAHPGWLDLRVGQRARGPVIVAIPDGRGLVAARLNARGPPTVIGAAPAHHRLSEHVRERFRRICATSLGHRAAGLLPGLVLGDTSTSDPSVDEEFRRAGLTHLLAVSGANFALIVGTAVLLIAVCGGSIRVTVFMGLGVTAGFAVLVQLSPSVIRASIMGGIALLAMATARGRAAMPALAAAIVVALVVWPRLATDVGFGMSVAATAALIAWSPSLRDRLVDRGVPRGVADAVAMSTIAFVVTAPLVAVISGHVSWTAVLANIAVAPVIPLVTVLGAVAMTLAAADLWVTTALAHVLVAACEPALWWILGVARFLGGPWAAVPAAPSWLLIIGLGVVGVRAVRSSLARLRS